MAVESDAARMRVTKPRSPAVAAKASSEPTLDADCRAVLAVLPADAPRSLAQGPGRLDVIGGVASYTGALTVTLPLAPAATVGVQRRVEPTLTVTRLSTDPERHQAHRLSLVQLFDEQQPVDAERGRKVALVAAACKRLLCAVGAVLEVIRAAHIKRPDHGLAIAVAPPPPTMPECARDAAFSAAAVTAVAAALDVALDLPAAARICQQVEHGWLQSLNGPSDAHCALLGEPGVLLQSCADGVSLGPRLPEGVAALGVGCGWTDPSAGLRRARARTAAWMGRHLIDRIIAHEGPGKLSWDGNLCRISAADFVQRFRDRLPMKFTGREYLERFGETGDGATCVEPEFTYGIRSRTEHHIYENFRARAFIGALSRGIRTGEEQGFIEAGRLMYKSHWSYGQRCALSSAPTDKLVNCIRARPVEHGIYGARTSSAGCGGVVTVLMRRDERARRTLAAAIEAYEAETGRQTTIHEDGFPGVFVKGIRRL